MRYAPAAFSAAFLLAAVASAAPVSWVNMPGPIASRGLLGSANNTVLSAPAMAAPGLWYYMTISGNLNKVAASTHANEACIEVTTPNGDKFVIKPFTTGSFNSTIAVPAGAMTTPPFWTFGSGACSLRFFELYADNASGPDSTWTDLQITLHNGDGGDTMPFSYGISTSAENPDTHATGGRVNSANTPTPDEFVFTHSRVVNQLRAKGYGTIRSGWNANSSLSPLGVVRYEVTAPRADGAGNVTWQVAPFEPYAASSTSFDVVFDTPVPVRTGPSYEWSMRALCPGALAAPNTDIASVWINFQPLTGDAPASTNLGMIRSAPWAVPGVSVQTPTFTSQPGQIKWYRFDTEHDCNAASGYWVDIHTQIPVNSPIDDHEIAVYSPLGNRIAFDDDGGSDNRSMLTFGAVAPVRPAVLPVSSPELRDGHDGPLAAGVHYLAVTQYDASFDATGFFATTNGNETGQIVVEFRTNLPPPPCSAADIGSQGGIAVPDWALDNNDFVVFIDAFFNHAAIADRGTTGGIPGADGAWDNNDFIVFIDQFFAGCE